MGRTVIRELTDLVRAGHEIAPGTIEAIAGALDRHESPSRILEDVVWRHRGLKVAPKTVNQKRYVDAIRGQTITVGIGPAGTGKSFLAVAMAVAALSRREVNRIVLTRPAVEAGERLGFLPGDIAAKVDPYLRPLFDALYDMLEPERVNQHLERGVIEVAPLAFMRGRAQPLGRQVLTPGGFRPIGSLDVGDLVDRRERPRDAGARRVPARPEGGLPRPDTGRRVDPLLRGAPVVRHHPGRPPARQGRPRARDARDDRSAASQAPAPLRAATGQRPCRAAASARADRAVRARPAARRRLPDDLDHSKLRDYRLRARRGARGCVAWDRAPPQERGRLRLAQRRGRARRCDRGQSGQRDPARARVGRHALLHEVRARSTTSTTALRRGWRCSRGYWTATEVRSGNADAPAACSTRPALSSWPTTSSSWSAHSEGLRMHGGGRQRAAHRAWCEAGRSITVGMLMSWTSGCRPA